MRTVILNSLDPTFKRKDVFFRAFEPEEIVWFDFGLDELAACSEAMIAWLNGQITRQDYQLVVLTDLEHFPLSEYGDVRQSLEKLATAHLNAQLLPPLDREDLLPIRITVIFTYFRNRADAEMGRNLYHMLLQLEPEKPVDRLVLPYSYRGSKDGELDLSDTLRSSLTQLSSQESGKPPAKTASSAKTPNTEEPEDDLLKLSREGQDERRESRKQAAEQYAESILHKQIELLQEYRISRKPTESLLPVVCEFPFQVKDRSVGYADLQIALSQLIFDFAQKGPAAPDAHPVSHEEQELITILANARDSAEFYLNTDMRLKYYELSEPYALEQAAEVEVRIRDRLRKELSAVPGIKEATDELDRRRESEPTNGPEGESSFELEESLRASWLNVEKERQSFLDLYHALRGQYDRDQVLEDQKQILDICSDEFLSWRADKRQGRPAEKKPSVGIRPAVPESQRQSLTKLQERCADCVLESLNDYEDVRVNGAELHTRFRAETRLWSPDRQSRNSRSFLRFSCIMGLVFVLLMVLPYILLETQKTDLPVVSKFPFFAIACIVFCVLYAAGVLKWIHRLCGKISKLSWELSQLLYHSADARRKSILSTVEAYGRLLPEYLLRQLNLEAMEDADRKNDRLEKFMMLHKKYLHEVLNEIDDMRTAMRLGELPKGNPDRGEIRYDRPPYSPENREIYMLFREEGGKS